MKRPRPTAPVDAPLGTVSLGGEVEWFSASLQVSSTDLDPEDVTRLLGEKPTKSQRNGIPLLRDDGSVHRVPRFGRWSKTLTPSQTDEWDVSEVVRTLFESLPDKPEVWREVARLGSIRVSLGLAVSLDSQDFSFDAELIRLLAERSASVWFDIYRETQNET